MNNDDNKVVEAELATDIPSDILTTNANTPSEGLKNEAEEESLGEKISDMAEKAKEKIKDTASKIGEKSKEAYDKAYDKIADSLTEDTVEAETPNRDGLQVEGSLNMGTKALAGFLRNSVFSAPGIVFADSDSLAPLKNIKKELLPSKGYKFDLEDNVVKIDLFVYALYGISIPDAFEKIKRELEISLQNMLGLKISEINMEVLDLLIQEDYDLVIASSKGEE